MNVLQKVIIDLDKTLQLAIGQSEWYGKQLKEAELKIIELKETIAQIKTLAQEGK